VKTRCKGNPPRVEWQTLHIFLATPGKNGYLTVLHNFGRVAVSGDLDRTKTDALPWKAVFQHDLFFQNTFVRCNGSGLGPGGRRIWR
jgi:hypothetical protein